jgi:two-component system NarL family sensor kinase
MSSAVLAAYGLTGVSVVVSGLALVVGPRSRWSGLLAVLAGALLLAAVVVRASGSTESAGVLFALAAEVGIVSLVAFPWVRTEDPVGFLALGLTSVAPVATVILAGAGGVAPVAAVTWVPGVSLTVLVLHLWWRLEHATRTERRALWWMALSVGAALTVAVFATLTSASFTATPLSGGPIAFALVTALVGPAMAVGARSPEVVEVRTLLTGFVVRAAAAASYLVLFLTATAFLEVLGQSAPSIETLAVLGVLCAFAFHPVQVALRGVVDELLFGHRPDPLDAASLVAERWAGEPEVALAVVREALMVPYVRLVVDGREVAVSGTVSTEPHPVPLAIGDGREGRLEVGLRPGDLTLGEADLWVLRLVAPLVSQTLRVQSLVQEVQASREDTVAALEEERRRLRRDLHDGLGPRLAGIAYTAGAARNVLDEDADAARSLLLEVRREAADAIREIRQLVYDMRPPALDELGLVAALEQRVPGLGTPDGRPFPISVEAEDLPALPAAVEVAAYRIALEAMANAAGHSGGDGASVRFRVVGSALELEVVDRGVGQGPWAPGVGLGSMRERAEELGGEVRFDGEQGGRVWARLPLPTRPSPGPMPA